jgi:hypothetical protein
MPVLSGLHSGISASLSHPSWERAMLIYVDEVLREIDSIRGYACLISQKFDAGRDAADMRMDNLTAMLPEPRMAGHGPRHSAFMIHFLEKGEIDRCRQDITDICDHDLAETAEAIREWSSKLAWVDADLRRDILPLIRFCQFDSAIRKAFVILKTRLCRKFNLDEKIDGEDLVNELFGSKSTRFPEMSPSEGAAYRNLFAGMFGLLRNRFAHNDAQPDLSDLHTAIANVNMCLRM